MSRLSQSSRAIETYSYDEETATGAIDETTDEFRRLYALFLQWARATNLVQPVPYEAREEQARELRCHVAATQPDLYKLVDHNNPDVYNIVLLKWNDGLD
jgi:hypothetical protein